MGRARRARKIAATAAFGGGLGAAGAGAVGLLGYGVLKAEATLARRAVGDPVADAPDDDGRYGSGLGEPFRMLVLGDSSAAGVGCQRPEQTMGAIIAGGVAALTGRPVDLVNVAVSGAKSPDLDDQVVLGLQRLPDPDVAMIFIGANDVTHRLDRVLAVGHLSEAVTVLRAAGAEIVVGTCPDLGVVRPIAPPLRQIARRWSRDLAAAQTVAVVEAGGRTVSLGDLIGPDFVQRPQEMFSIDRFHPSPAGYARAASAMLPSVCAALGLTSVDTGRQPDRRRGEGVGPVSHAAVRAVRDPGTEVSATDLGGQKRSRAGRWALLLRRHRDQIPEPDDATPAKQDSVHTRSGSAEDSAAGLADRAGERS
ncbi:SGNH/GDSL hydrolase family protein [Segeticoccus rhizosphaerae]|jgi:lysophospholipase L1-like esterase|uniref:SGNH/GDSL hydrolase family protein n=2 Tax=Segeticoccus rhizosphaerae TaxID=1104777 RepID=UPI0010BFE962|nr:SGNH/GDSL hydrolase family protein [Ornithinicoccus soli]